MAVTWGTAKGTGTKFRVGLEVTVPPVTSTTTSVVVTTNIWIWTKDKVSDSSTTLTISGTAAPVGSQTITVSTPSNSDWSTSNKKLVATKTLAFNTTTAAQPISVTASVTGMNAAGASTVATETLAKTIAALPILAPAAPVSCAVARVNDSVQAITWVNTSPSDANRPYQAIEVWRWDNKAPDYYRIAVIGLATSYTDVSTIVDRRFRYAVRAWNAAGVSGWSFSDFIETTTAAPTGLVAQRPATDVIVSWANVTTIGTSVELWRAQDDVWEGAALATLTLDNASYTDAGAPTDKALNYRVRTLGAIASPFLYSQTVPVPVPPVEPAITGPNGVFDASKPITLSWSFMTGDGSTQTAYKPHWREQGTPEWQTPSGISLGATANATTNEILCSGHRLNLGDVLTLTGTMPVPLVQSVKYYAIPASADRFTVALSEEDAEAGTSIDITSSTGSFMVATGRIAGNNTIHEIAGLDPGKAWEWSLRTYGRFTGINPGSPWARVGGFRTASRPMPTVIYPDDGSTISSPKAMLSWIFYSADAGVLQQWARVALYKGDTGKLLESFEADGEWFDYSFTTDLINGADYRIDLTVEGDNGIRSDLTSTSFTAEYVGPTAPGVVAEWNTDEGEVVLYIQNPVDNDRPPAISNTIWRSVDGSDFELWQSGVGTDTTLVDPLPTPNTINTYRVQAFSADGTNEILDVAVNCDNAGDWYWLNGGPGFTVKAKVRYSAGVSITFGLDKTLQQFAGRTRPVEFSGTIRKHEIQLSATLPRDEEGWATLADLMVLADTAGPVMYRDPIGRRLLCSLGDIQFDDSENLINFQTTLTEVSS